MADFCAAIHLIPRSARSETTNLPRGGELMDFLHKLETLPKELAMTNSPFRCGSLWMEVKSFATLDCSGELHSTR